MSVRNLGQGLRKPGTLNHKDTMNGAAENLTVFGDPNRVVAFPVTHLIGNNGVASLCSIWTNNPTSHVYDCDSGLCCAPKSEGYDD
jgi:hypothetical protein